jgi:hypothetical protein
MASDDTGRREGHPEPAGMNAIEQFIAHVTELVSVFDGMFGRRGSSAADAAAQSFVRVEDPRGDFFGGSKPYLAFGDGLRPCITQTEEWKTVTDRCRSYWAMRNAIARAYDEGFRKQDLATRTAEIYRDWLVARERLLDATTTQTLVANVVEDSPQWHPHTETVARLATDLGYAIGRLADRPPEIVTHRTRTHFGNFGRSRGLAPDRTLEPVYASGPVATPECWRRERASLCRVFDALRAYANFNKPKTGTTALAPAEAILHVDPPAAEQHPTATDAHAGRQNPKGQKRKRRPRKNYPVWLFKEITKARREYEMKCKQLATTPDPQPQWLFDYCRKRKPTPIDVDVEFPAAFVGEDWTKRAKPFWNAVRQRRTRPTRKRQRRRA